MYNVCSVKKVDSERKLMKEQEYAKTTFDDVASRYDEIEFFKISARYVAKLIKEHKPQEELDILDVACGTGNVVLECATCLKKSSFDGFDISEGMLATAKNKATKQNIHNVKFHLQDITKFTVEKRYDVITCSYALFFLPDAVNVLKTLVGLLKEDGILIFTTFTAEAFMPSSEILLSFLVRYGSLSAKEYDIHKWENLKHIKDIERLCKEADVVNFTIDSQEIRYGLSLDAWWELYNNTGFKGMLMELSSEDYELMKSEFYEAMQKYVDNDGEAQLIADTYFTVVHHHA